MLVRETRFERDDERVSARQGCSEQIAENPVDSASFQVRACACLDSSMLALLPPDRSMDQSTGLLLLFCFVEFIGRERAREGFCVLNLDAPANFILLLPFDLLSTYVGTY